MLHTIQNSAILLAVITMCGYGFGSPFMKAAASSGASQFHLSGIYAVALVITGMDWPPRLPTPISGKTFACALAFGLFAGIAFRASGRAFALPSGHLSVVTIIIAAFPLVSSAIGLLFLGEASRVHLGRLLIGSALTIAGITLVGISRK